MKFSDGTLFNLRSPIVITMSLFIVVSIALSFSRQSVDTGRVKVEANSVSDSLCLSWKIANSDTTVFAHTVNGAVDSADSVDLRVADKMKQLRAGALVENRIGRGKKLRITAQGIAANQVSDIQTVVTTNGIDQGLAAGPCPSLGQDWWFQGINTESGYSEVLVLSNPDDTDSLVSITGFTAAGEYPLVQFKEVVVAANGSRKIDLTATIPGVSAAAIHVQLLNGRIAASLQTQVYRGPQAFGRSYIAPISTPTNVAVISGIHSAAVEQTLFVMSPNADATIKVTAYSGSTKFPVAAAQGLLIPKGQVRTFDVSHLSGQAPEVFVVESDQPIVSSVSFVVPRSSVNDFEVISQQNSVNVSAVASVPDGGFNSALFGFARTDATVTLQAYVDGKLLWSKDTEFSEGQSQPLALESKVAPKTVLVVSTASADVFVTQWLTQRVANGSLSAAVSISRATINSTHAAQLHFGTL